MVIAAVYGAGPDLDAYFVALGLSNILLGLLGTSMTRAATPVLAHDAAQESAADGCRGHRGFDVTLTTALIGIGAASVVMGLLAEPVAQLIAPGFSGAGAELLHLLTRVVLVTVVVIAATDLLAALAQAHGVFAWGAAQGVPFNLIMIGAAGLFGPRYGIAALAVGFVLGSLARLALQVVPVLRHRWRVRPGWDLRNPAFRQIVAILPPLVVGQAVLNVNTLVDRAVASTVDGGAVTVLALSWRLVNLPEVLVVGALVTSLYPAMGANSRERPEVGRLVLRGLSTTVTLLVPMGLALALTAQPAVRLAFGRGAFDAPAVASTASAVVWFVPGLLALGIRQVVVSACYAVGNARGPVTISVLAMVVNVVGDLTLAPVWGVEGIVLATSVSLTIAALLTAQLAARLGMLPWPAVRGLLVRASVGAAAAGAAGYVVRRSLVDAPDVAVVLVVAVLVATVYLLVLTVLRAPERRLPAQILAQLGAGRRHAGER